MTKAELELKRFMKKIYILNNLPDEEADKIYIYLDKY
jgi:hypothetical protein